MSRLEHLEGDAWREVAGAPFGLIVLAKSTCPVCRAWSEELAAFLESDHRFEGLRIGEIFLYEDGPVAANDEDDEEEDGTPAAISRAVSAARGPQGGFARANRDWLDEVYELPHNVLYAGGERIKSWPGRGIDRLVNRLEGLAPK